MSYAPNKCNKCGKYPHLIYSEKGWKASHPCRYGNIKLMIETKEYNTVNGAVINWNIMQK